MAGKFLFKKIQVVETPEPAKPAKSSGMPTADDLRKLAASNPDDAIWHELHDLMQSKPETGKFQEPVPVPVTTRIIEKTTLYADSDNGVAGDYKQWSVWVEPKSAGEFFVVTEWGRVGWKLQTNRKPYYGKLTAIREKRKLIESKRAKGYRNKP